jgi:hypothetical protein
MERTAGEGFLSIGTTELIFGFSGNRPLEHALSDDSLVGNRSELLKAR